MVNVQEPAAGKIHIYEMASSNVWTFGWHTIANPAGGFTSVETIRREPCIPHGEKEASKEDFDRAFETDAPEIQTAVVLHTGQNSTNGTELLVKYFRGPIYTSTNVAMPWKEHDTSDQKMVSIVSTIDNTKIVAGIDNGLIYTSTNSGMTWETISAPGKHSISIVLGDGGCGIFAVQTISGKEQSTSNVNWYAVATGSDGSGLIATRNSLQSPPALNIALSNAEVIISWPSFATGYLLQQNSDLATTNWIDVNVEPSVVNEQNRVILSEVPLHNFYRLRSQ